MQRMKRLPRGLSSKFWRVSKLDVPFFSISFVDISISIKMSNNWCLRNIELNWQSASTFIDGLIFTLSLMFFFSLDLAVQIKSCILLWFWSQKGIGRWEFHTSCMLGLQNIWPFSVGHGCDKYRTFFFFCQLSMLCWTRNLFWISKKLFHCI